MMYGLVRVVWLPDSPCRDRPISGDRPGYPNSRLTPPACSGRIIEDILHLHRPQPEGYDSMRLTLGPGEPAAGPWRAITIGEFARELLGSADAGSSRLVLAVDGRSGSGKSTLARRLQRALPAATVVSTDDIAWHHSMFEWTDLAESGVLQPFRAGAAVRFRPPAWDTRDRPGHIDVPQGTSSLILEGVGASRRDLVPLLDRAVWVQSDYEVAAQRCLAREVANGVDPDEAQAFWDHWMTEEVPFLERDKPWERADAVIAGNTERPTDSPLIMVALPTSPPS
jgi:energy-coupling factor transporter ATP-binding protein EcfA2